MFVTAGVIVATLGQAFILPAVIRWARLPADDRDAQERHATRTTMLTETLEQLDELGDRLGTRPDVVDRLRRQYQRQLRVHQSREGEPASRDHQQYTALARAALHHERDVLLRLRDQKRIDDDTVVEIQARLDLAELRYHPPVEGAEA